MTDESLSIDVWLLSFQAHLPDLSSELFIALWTKAGLRLNSLYKWTSIQAKLANLSTEDDDIESPMFQAISSSEDPSKILLLSICTIILILIVLGKDGVRTIS